MVFSFFCINISSSSQINVFVVLKEELEDLMGPPVS